MFKGLFLYRVASGTTFSDSVQYQKIYKYMSDAVDKVPENEFNLLYFVDWIQHYDLAFAAKYFQRAIQIEPRFAKAYVLLGLASAQSGDSQHALQYYDQALAINEKMISAHFNKGLILAQKGEWRQSAYSFEQVVLLQPENSFAHSSLGQVYFMAQDYQQSLEHAIISTRLSSGQANLFFNLRLIYEKIGDVHKAIEAFEKGVKLAPNDARAQEKLKMLKTRT
jgi:tetratricopeptide (TPR) repeat protein